MNKKRANIGKIAGALHTRNKKTTTIKTSQIMKSTHTYTLLHCKQTGETHGRVEWSEYRREKEAKNTTITTATI